MKIIRIVALVLLITSLASLTFMQAELMRLTSRIQELIRLHQPNQFGEGAIHVVHAEWISEDTVRLSVAVPPRQAVRIESYTANAGRQILGEISTDLSPRYFAVWIAVDDGLEREHISFFAEECGTFRDETGQPSRAFDHAGFLARPHDWYGSEAAPEFENEQPALSLLDHVNERFNITSLQLFAVVASPASAQPGQR